jgi:hypothetical protein
MELSRGFKNAPVCPYFTHICHRGESLETKGSIFLRGSGFQCHIRGVYEVAILSRIRIIRQEGIFLFQALILMLENPGQISSQVFHSGKIFFQERYSKRRPGASGHRSHQKSRCVETQYSVLREHNTREYALAGRVN